MPLGQGRAPVIAETGACARRLDGRKMHFQHGPIDLIIGADGESTAVAHAHESAWQRFINLLPGLVSHLSVLRREIDTQSCPPVIQGSADADEVARAMVTASWPLRGYGLTPMAGVAGSVAEHICRCYQSRGIDRAWVNNGGDIALHVQPGASLRIAIAGSGQVPRQVEIGAHTPVRGVATSGWRGRSFSLGIADAVTVLARKASVADVAATLIANAVNVDAESVERRAASDLSPDSDLGGRLVTVAVGALSAGQVDAALLAGHACANRLMDSGLIEAASLSLAGCHRTCAVSAASALMLESAVQ